GTLQRILVEKRLKFRICHCFRCLTKAFLSVLQRFDEIVDCRDCFLLCSHTTVSRAVGISRSSFLARRATGRNFSYEQKRERLNKGTAAQSENAIGTSNSCNHSASIQKRHHCLIGWRPTTK